jgi:ABC-type glycerol-3-phosphate transport system substrate-binding protein
MSDDLKRRMSRRQMLQGAGLVLGSISGAALLAACGGGAAPAAAPTSAPAAAPTTAPAAAPKPTTAPAAAATTAPAAAAPTSAPAAAAKPATNVQPVTIRDHDWLQGNPGEQGDWYDAFIAQFEAAHPDIKISREWFPRNDMHAKELALAATGQIGDTVRINVAPITTELHIKGILHDLNSLWASDQEWMSNDQKQFWPGNIATYTQDGKVWGLPVVGHPGALQYYVNTTMVQKMGLKMPPADGSWSYDDMATLAKGLTQSSGGRTTVYGISPSIGNEGIVAFLRAFGGDLFDADGKKSLLATAESKAGLHALAGLYSSGSAIAFDPDINNQDLFQSGKIGMAIMTSFAASAWPGQIAKLPDPFEMDVFPNPLGPTGKHASQVSSDGKGVSMTTQNPDKAWIVLSRLFTSQAHGIGRFGAGLGSPGSRNDVWGSDEFNKIAPKLANIAKVLVLPPAPALLPWNHPANGRYAEHEPILINEFNKVTLGQLDVDKFADDTSKMMQDILDKPNV